MTVARSCSLLILVGAGAILVGLLAPAFVSRFSYAQQQHKVSDLINSLSGCRPNTASPAEWEAATTWTGIAVANVCYSPEHVPLEELRQFRNELESKLDGDVDLDSLGWIWDRLATTGPHGARYAAKFEVIYRADIARAARQE